MIMAEIGVSPLAAVYDRRGRQRNGAHIDPLK